MIKHTVRIGRMVAGIVLLIVGAILALPMVPGPGIAVALLGLWLLGHEFEWARRLRDWARREFHRVTGRDHVG